MASNRKLSEAIEKNLKKVSEGVEAFDDIWDKFYSASTPAHKEKFEAELKREIKKLQRLRDDIKRWLSSSEIKDKSQLLEARRLIETKMESFKVCEREAKTKAYSKEGLQAQSRLDPQTQLKVETENWLADAIERLEVQCETVEADVEQLGNNFSKKKSKQDQEQLERLERLLESHRMHVDNLETILRLFSNDEIDVEEITNIKETVEYYIESNQDPDFVPDDEVYDEILSRHAAAADAAGRDSDSDNSDDELSSSASVPLTATNSTSSMNGSGATSTPAVSSTALSSSSNTVPAAVAKTKSAEDSRKPQETALGAQKLTKTTSAAAPSQPSMPASSQSASQAQSSSAQMQQTQSATAKKPMAAVVASQPGPGAGAAPSSGPLSGASLVSPSLAPSPALAPAPSPSPLNGPASVQGSVASAKPFHEVVKKTAQKEKEKTSPKTSASSTNAGNAAGVMQPPSQLTMPSAATSTSSAPTTMAAAIGAAINSPTLQQGQGLAGSQAGMPQLAEVPQLATASASSGPTAAAVVAAAAGVGGGLASPSVVSSSGGLPPMAPPSSTASPAPHPMGMSAPSANAPSYTSAMGSAYPLDEVLSMLEASIRHLPGREVMPASSGGEEKKSPVTGPTADSDYQPMYPYVVPDSFPQQPLNELNDPALFEKFDVDTLFFIFYYQQGTYAQYLAAKELKRQSWRFHKKYLTWFQRHNEPKHITDEFEQGTYVYFDYESGWCQRIKSEFTFEYAFLENDLA
eukprot:ANDGO_02664.mRNA.1 General negative regulator of transcription subunit 3